MAFRRDSKVDAFQRQISALRHQLGGEPDTVRDEPVGRYTAIQPEHDFRHTFPDVELQHDNRRPSLREFASLGAEPSLDLGQQLPAIPSIDTETSVVAHATAWNGNLESTGSLHVYGRVEGALTARDDIFVAEGAEVDAVIVAANVTIAGNVRGTIQCASRCEVLPAGRVAANVRAPAIVIHDGALLAGEIAMTTSGDVRRAVAPSPGVRAATVGD